MRNNLLTRTILTVLALVSAPLIRAQEAETQKDSLVRFEEALKNIKIKQFTKNQVSCTDSKFSIQFDSDIFGPVQSEITSDDSWTQGVDSKSKSHDWLATQRKSIASQIVDAKYSEYLNIIQLAYLASRPNYMTSRESNCRPFEKTNTTGKKNFCVVGESSIAFVTGLKYYNEKILTKSDFEKKFLEAISKDNASQHERIIPPAIRNLIKDLVTETLINNSKLRDQFDQREAVVAKEKKIIQSLGNLGYQLCVTEKRVTEVNEIIARSSSSGLNEKAQDLKQISPASEKSRSRSSKGNSAQ